MNRLKQQPLPEQSKPPGSQKDDNYLSHYLYNAGGERVWKLTGEVRQMTINGGIVVDHADLNNKTLYTSPYMILTDEQYTKHYFAGSERISTRIGGGFDNNLVDPLQYQVSNPLNSDYDALATNLWEIMIRQSECVEIGEYVTMEHSLAVVEAMMGADEYEEGQYFYHPDHLGSASFITDVGGAATQHLQYLPFGESYIDQRNSSYDERFKCTGKEKDAETDFNYFGARYYDAGVSVWLSVDPMADHYPNLSAYCYTTNNPIVFIDPDGNRFIDANGRRIKVKVKKDGTIVYKFRKGTDQKNKDQFLNNHSKFFEAIATTKEGRKRLRKMNRIRTKIQIEPDNISDENEGHSDVVPLLTTKRGEETPSMKMDLKYGGDVYEQVTIKPHMGNIENTASEQDCDINEILGAVMTVEFVHLHPNQIKKDLGDQSDQVSVYTVPFNEYVHFRIQYRKTKGQELNLHVFENRTNMDIPLSPSNSKEKDKITSN